MAGTSIYVTENAITGGGNSFTGGLLSGSSATDVLCVPTGCYDVTVGGGSYDSEITFDFGSNAGTYTNIAIGDPLACAVYGCTDSTATNYDASANTDDGSCVYPCLDNEVAVDMFDSWGDGWNGATYTVTDANGTVMASGGLTSGSSGTDAICLPDGCYDISVGGGSYRLEITFMFNFGSLTGATAGTYQVCWCNVAVFGCTDSTAD